MEYIITQQCLPERSLCLKYVGGLTAAVFSVQCQQWWDPACSSLYSRGGDSDSPTGGLGGPLIQLLAAPLASVFIHCWSIIGRRWKLVNVYPASRFRLPPFWWPPQDFQCPIRKRFWGRPLAVTKRSGLCGSDGADFDCMCVTHSFPTP